MLLLIQFSHTQWTQNGLWLQEKKLYKDLFPVVICNPSSNFNIAFRISQSGFAEVLQYQNFVLNQFYDSVHIFKV